MSLSVKEPHVTKSSLIEEAILQFSESGFSETSVRSICKEVGVSVAAINYHFGNKNNLVLAVIENSISKFIVSLEESAIENPDNFKDFLSSYGLKLSSYSREVLIVHRNILNQTSDEFFLPERIEELKQKFFTHIEKFSTQLEFNEEFEHKMELFHSSLLMEILKRSSFICMNKMSFEDWLKKKIDILF